MNTPSIQPDQVKRILVRGVNWVGDAVMTIPALRELRHIWPHAHITLATRSWAKDIFADADFIDEIMVLEKRRGLDVRSALGLIRQWQSFDLAVLFQNAFDAALIAAAARVPVRIGYQTDGRRLLLTHPLALPAWRHERHEVFYYLHIVHTLKRLLGDMTPAEEQIIGRGDLYVSDQRRSEARKLLASYGARAGRRLVVLCPGSINSQAKRWPADRFAQLADSLIEHASADVALVGSPEELSVAEQILGRMRHRPLVLTGRTTLAQTVMLISIADCLITNDTGPAHIAAALNRPTLVIFGPTNPLTTRPFSKTADIIRHPPPCAPCMLRECPIDHRCMTAITPAEVFARAVRMMEEQQPPSAEVPW